MAEGAADAKVGRATTVALVGLHAVPVTVEAHLGNGLPAFYILGASGPAAREAADRVRTALAAAGMPLPSCKALVSLAPADVPKMGARFDLAMAAAVLAQRKEIPEGCLERTALIGELGLDATVRAVPGVLPSAAALPAAGVERLLVADRAAAEARWVEGLDVVPVRDLAEAVAVLAGRRAPRPAPARRPQQPAPGPDLADVRGQAEARRALEVAAAGGHHLLLVGPPGCGKSMLAARLPGLLPALTRAQALEVAAVRSVAGRLPDGILDHRPPFGAPHHTTTRPALLGGGSGVARPGLLSLAHHGVLFLDELFEWPRALLESLREPLEEGVVRVARSQATVTYPARVLLVCAANPCPCGGGDRCACSDEQVAGYRARLSGPLADRLDLAPVVEPLTASDLLTAEAGEPSSLVAARVAAGRRAAAERWGSAELTNATVAARRLRATAAPAALRVLASAVERGALTGRGFDRALRVARTIADLAGETAVASGHAHEAVAHRLALRPVQHVGAAL